MLLTQGGVTSERVRVGFDGERRRDAIGNVDDGAPLGEAGSELVVLDQPLAQSVESLGDRLVRKTGEGLGAHIDLDPRHDAEARQVFGERLAVAGLLPEGLIVQDDPGDRLRGARRGEQHLPVGPPLLFGRIELDRIEALLDRSGALVGRENTPVLGHHGVGNARQLAAVHRRHLLTRPGPQV